MDNLPQELIDKIKYFNPHPVAVIFKKRVHIFSEGACVFTKGNGRRMKLHHDQRYIDGDTLEYAPYYERKVIKAKILNHHQHLDYIYVHINKDYIKYIINEDRVPQATRLLASKLLLVPKPWKIVMP